MAEPRPVASLTASLLARKGSARPAMRSALHGPEGYPADPAAANASAVQADDLGWNDYGAGVPASSRVVRISEPSPVVTPAMPPLVVRQQAAIASRIATPSPAPAAKLQVPPRRSALASGRRAAFTLRLAADRHLALRLATALLGRSAQQIVTEALDRMLDEHPEIRTIADKVGASR